MKDKGLWPAAIGLLSTALLVAACTPSVTTTTATATATIPTVTSRETAAPSERPQYGGTLNLGSLLDIGVFDPVATGQWMGAVGQLVGEQYLGEDWTRGAAGTGELDWVPNRSPAPDTCMGVLAESWEMPSLGTIVFKVRRGVHWAINPNSEASRLMNGREVTADDWIASFNYLMQHPRSIIKTYQPQVARTATTEKTGPWEVTVKTPVDPLIGWNWLAWGLYAYYLMPPEVISKYGDMRDWRNVVGTGPFMLSDFVAGSSATLVRNPNYWGKDPVGPGKGSQLPYIDAVKILVITDVSTALAAFRTAKHDIATGVGAEETQSLMGLAPALQSRTYMQAMPGVIAMRLDKAELPYKDKRVRQALMMAIDFNALKDDYYGGDADVLAFPVTREAKRAYMPLEEMPESVQSLYRYSPDKAKQLLAEAGYPTGFKARMIVLSSFGVADLASVFKAMWTKVGIDVEIQPRELGVFNSIAYARAYEDMMLVFLSGGGVYPTCLNLGAFRSPGSLGYVNDPFIQAAHEEIQKHVIIDMPGADRLYRELMPYIVGQSYYISLPSTKNYSLWWPWVKNYNGETPTRLATYYWINQDLKQEMTGRR